MGRERASQTTRQVIYFDLEAVGVRIKLRLTLNHRNAEDMMKRPRLGLALAGRRAPAGRRALEYVALGWYGVLASCPNYKDLPYCSGHGDCNPFGRCQCWPGWTSGDCSERTCPTSLAWQDTASDHNVAHAAAECSNRGKCDRLTGRCTCDEAFEGSACERLRCRGMNDVGQPVACSGHGQCRSMHQLARWTVNDRSERFTYADVWDAHKIQGCVCSEEYTGAGCSVRTCPVGDDPLTSGQSNEIQLVSCGGRGSFTLVFKGTESLPIKASYSAAKVQDALRHIHSLGDIEVRFAHPNSAACHTDAASFEDRNVILIEFKSLFGTAIPKLKVGESAAETFAGIVEIKSAREDGDQAFVRTGAGYAYAVPGSKESEECARRGACSAGVCDCFATNFELYGSSNLYGGPGSTGDCGFPLTDITRCPGEDPCNNHGVCRDEFDQTETPFPTPDVPNARFWKADAPFECICHYGWKLGDCSQRVCPRHFAWFGYPSANEAAHDGLVECSGVGSCNRRTGACACPAPFIGTACEFMDCPPATMDVAPCHGKGRCLSMRELAEKASVNGVTHALRYGDNPNDPYTWDADRVFGCLCDEGYHGHDCSLRSCPHGDDPNTFNQYNELQLLRCYADGGAFSLSFRDRTTRERIPHNATASHIRAALKALPSITDIRVAFSFGEFACTHRGTRNIISVQFLTEHADLPPLAVDTSQLTRSLGRVRFWVATDGTALTDGAGTTLASRAGTTESEPCSNRGICNTASGLCDCFAAYTMSNGHGGPGAIPDCGYKRPY